jgi:hypothetical protein
LFGIEAWRNAVWVENATNHTVMRINPATGEVVTRIVLPKTAKAIGEAADLFWVAVWPN